MKVFDPVCLPATSFCEPLGIKPASWHWFAMADAEPRPPLAFPGVWRRWRGTIKKDGPKEGFEEKDLKAAI
jgi:hypothetical protein